MLPSDGPDEIDGSEKNATLRRALELTERTIDDLTDVEVILRQTDDGWFADLCIGELNKLPSEVESWITMRECTLLQARGVVKQAQSELSRMFADHKLPGMLNEPV